MGDVVSSIAATFTSKEFDMGVQANQKNPSLDGDLNIWPLVEVKRNKI